MCLVLVLSFVPAAMAEDSSMSFDFVLTTDGRDSKKVETGDYITVAFNLKRSDSSEDYIMYAMQNEIRYDDKFFEFVEGSAMLKSDVEMKNIGLRGDSGREIYMNYLSSSGGSTWSSNTIVGSFQLKVIAESGASTISNQDYLVSTSDGMDKFSASCSDLKIVVSEDCTVSFITNCDIALDSSVVAWGEKLDEPGISREGFKVEGWYRDMDFKERWDFENDSVEENMNLYAKWIVAEDNETEDISSGLLWIIPVVLLAVLAAAYFVFRKKRANS